MSAGHSPHMSGSLDSAGNEVRYYEKRKYSVVVKAAECFPTEGLLPLPQDSYAMLGKSKAAMQGVTKNPNSTVTYPQQLLTAEMENMKSRKNKEWLCFRYSLLIVAISDEDLQSWDFIQNIVFK